MASLIFALDERAQKGCSIIVVVPIPSARGELFRPIGSDGIFRATKSFPRNAVRERAYLGSFEPSPRLTMSRAVRSRRTAPQARYSLRHRCPSGNPGVLGWWLGEFSGVR